jgi:hypothetical protein
VSGKWAMRKKIEKIDSRQHPNAGFGVGHTDDRK